MKPLLAVAITVLCIAPAAYAAQPLGGAGAQQAPATLRAGAARIDFTPAQLPASILGVLDPVYVRAMVMDNGGTRAALVSVDAGSVSTDLFNKVSARAAQELKIPAA